MISSSSAQRGSPGMAHYAASKGALLSLTRSLAREYGTAGITVNNIPPSGIETPMQRQSQATGHLPSNEQMAASIPIGRSAPATTSRPRWDSCAPKRPASSPGKRSASTAER
jgi:NAD(P)-dependent dehydrogenase (short-subunit alcohol dehydrogenase family)